MPRLITTIALRIKIQLGLVVLGGVLLLPNLSEAMEIRQEMYPFQMSVTRDVSCQTFVIDDLPSFRIFPRANCCLPVTYFALGSSTLPLAAGGRILTGLKRCGITQQNSLVVTGHTCEFGPERLNQALSRQRAEAVAALLQKNGFNVAMVQGKGSHETISNEPGEFSVNRRVEIDLQHDSAPPSLLSEH